MRFTMNKSRTGPKVLLFDIETAPILASVWGLWDQNVGLNQIQRDWFVLSFSAKWLDSKKIIYADQRDAKDIENDKELLKKIWALLDEADIVVGQNSNKFDIKKLNARFILNGLKPPSSYKKIDTLVLAKRHFAFTSNKLEYLSDKLCTKFKKLKHANFPGFELWKQCLAGNKAAWNEMKRYNERDVLALEELYLKLAPWDTSINFDLYNSDTVPTCTCGSKQFTKNGYHYTATGKFQRFKCIKCGAETRDKVNLFSKEKKQFLRTGIVRG